MNHKNTILLFLLFTFFLNACTTSRYTAPPKAKTSSTLSERLEKIQMTDLAGNKISLHDFSNKPIFLNFWATWCGPCKAEMASIENAYQQFKNDVHFIAVSTEDISKIKAYQQKRNVNFTFAKLDIDYVEAYVIALPTTMLIKNGEIIFEEESMRQWDDPAYLDKIKQLLD